MMNAKNTEQLFKESTEFFRKTTEMFSGGLSQQMAGKTPNEFYKWWSNTMQESFKKATNAVDSELLTSILHRSLQNGLLYLNAMNMFLFSAIASNGKAVKSEQWKEFAEKFSQQSQEWYQEHLGKYLDPHQMGMYREHLTKITAVIDAYNIFLAEVGNFSEKSNVPFTQSLEIFQEALKDYQKGGNSAVQEKMSTLFMNVLGKQYDAFLKSSECAKGVTDVIHKYVEFQQQLKTVLDAWGKWLSIPTKGELEEVHKDLHQLKKKTQEQEKLIAKLSEAAQRRETVSTSSTQEQEKLIADLSQRIQKLESSSAAQEQEKLIADLSQKVQELESSLKTAAPKKKTTSRSTARKTSSTKSPSKTAATNDAK